MSGSNSKLADKNFINWIKATFASNIVKDGIGDFCERAINQFHQQALKSIATKEQIENHDLCSSCSIENVLLCPTRNFCVVKHGRCNNHDSKQKVFQPCPRNICNQLQEIIRKYHDFNCPSWKNTHTENWCNHPLELGKCYLPPDGYLDKTSIQEIDLNGILSILLNHTSFKQLVDESLCQEVRSFGNRLRHSANLCVDEHTLGRYLSTLVAFLKSVQNDLKAKEATKTILQLQKEELSISNGDITKLLEKCVEEKLQHSVQEISEKTKQELHDLREAVKDLKSQCISDIISAKEEAIERINTAAEAVVLTVEKQIEKLEGAKKDVELVPNQATNQEKSFEQLKSMFKKDLTSFNEHRHSTIPVSPLFEDMDALISEFYVRPDIVAVHCPMSEQQGSEIRVTLNSLQEMFNNAGKRYNEIYLTADAGFGKTSFSKYLVATWCQVALQSEASSDFSDEDITSMKRFDLVILLQLRDMCDDCDVDEMILNQIVNQFSYSSYFTMQFLQELLNTETCLIILDGLDEWFHPISSCRKKPKCIPHRKVRPTCTVLTTTRPWKLGTVDIKSSQINKRVELSQLSEDNISRLKFLAISKLERQNVNIQSAFDNFNTEIRIKELGSLESNPMLLVYLICIWREGKALGNSKTELYGQIIELLLSRAVHNSEWNEEIVATDSGFENLYRQKIPDCFREQDLCIKYYELLERLGHLGFETLFNENRKNTLIFDDKTTDGYLSKDQKSLSLFAGILTESKVRGGLTRKTFKVSFCHKTVQEFLAALYMHATLDQAGLVVKTITVCNSVERILEMSNLLVFLSGLNYETFIRISDKMTGVVNNDEISYKYRQGSISSTSNYSNIVKPLKDIQNMNIKCYNEVKRQEHETSRFCLQDLFIHEECSQGTYKENLQKLKKVNKCAIKSLDIRTEGIPNLHDIIHTFELHKETSLDKINFRGDCSTKDIECLISGSVDILKCVELLSSAWIGNKFTLKYVSWLDTLSITFQKMSKLEALHLYAFVMTHDQLSEMMTFIVQRTALRDIALLNLKCSDHNSDCSGCALDLSHHDSLRLLSLDNVPISHLSVNVSSLEDGVIGRLLYSGVLAAFLSSMKTATQLQRFTCRKVESSAQIDTMIETLNELASVRYVGLLYIDLGERNQLLGSGISNIEVVRLVEVTMKCSVLRSIVEVVKQLQQQVTVTLLNCEVKPADEYDIVKKDIKCDENVLVIVDGVCKAHITQFIFKSLGGCTIMG